MTEDFLADEFPQPEPEAGGAWTREPGVSGPWTWTPDPVTDPYAPEVADAVNAALGGSDFEPTLPEWLAPDAQPYVAPYEHLDEHPGFGVDADGHLFPLIGGDAVPPAPVAGEKPYIHHG